MKMGRYLFAQGDIFFSPLMCGVSYMGFNDVYSW